MNVELKWRIYYDDGSTFSNLDGTFEEAPSDGVLGVVEKDADVGRCVYWGKEHYYVLPDGTIGFADDLGPFLRGLGIIKFGRWTGKKPWTRALKRMVEDPDFPSKTSKFPWEELEI